MKFNKIIPFICLLMALGQVQAQSIKMSSYRFSEGLQFTTQGGKKIKLSGYIQPLFEAKHYTDSEDFDTENRFRLRRARFRIDGGSKDERFNYRVHFDLSGSSEVDNTSDNASSNYLLDAYVSYEVVKQLTVLFGQRSTYTDNRELFMASSSLQLVERSRLTSAFASIREFGLFLQGKFRTGKGSYLKPYLVVTNGDGANVFNKDHGSIKIGGRIDYLPFGLFTNFGQFRQADVMRERTPKLVIGANFSNNLGMSSRRGRNSGTRIYLDENGKESLPNYTKIGADFLFKYQGFSMLGEFVKSYASVPSDITQRILDSGSISTNFEIGKDENGNSIQDVENYVKGRMMLGEGYNIQAGYVFKSGISLDGRFTHLEADEYSFLNNETFYSRPNYYTIGLSKYLGRNYGAKIQTSVTYVDTAINDTDGNPIDRNELIGRLMLTFSF
ncbi:porin [Tenacibaculum sp. IB213877]|uniref:porin n=1 Tax=Tenacibaculum sp. IB213877 TaxID=3097351 RepID=UPI002A5A7D92|nr:porin [Tenacibaculum sp. IB213877]MDY0781428.1 porin [Tenacibaculum sp. IB213877]